MIEEFIDRNDLNYYFNAKNIPNQDLVFETYNFFFREEGKEYFDALQFLNILNWHYIFLTNNVEKPFDILLHFQNLSIQKVEKHILIGFLLKWFGGYPVNNLNTQYNTTLRLLEVQYLKVKNEYDQQGPATNDQDGNKQHQLDKLHQFLKKLDHQVNNRDQPDNLTSKVGGPNNSLKLKDNENIVQENKNVFVFISYSTKDEEIVTAFVDRILQLALKINLNNIFYTSIQSKLS